MQSETSPLNKDSLCDICKLNKGDSSAVINSVYYRRVCDPCKLKGAQASAGHARWSRSIDLEDHEHEIQQPYNADGTINARFAKLYPAQAKTLFTPEQLRDANR